MNDFDSLKQEIIDWSHRNDVDQRVDTFIQMAETVMYNNPIQILNVRGKETSLTIPTAGKTLALPADYLSMRSIRFDLNNDNGKLLFRTPEQMKRKSGTGRPLYFTVTDQIEFNQTPDQVYNLDIIYHAKPLPLSSTNQTNEVLVQNANIYLFGALAALFQYAQDEQMAAQNFQQFMSEIKGTNKTMKRGRYGTAPQMTLSTTTP